jgi:hypothetical protein
MGQALHLRVSKLTYVREHLYGTSRVLSRDLYHTVAEGEHKGLQLGVDL